MAVAQLLVLISAGLVAAHQALAVAEPRDDLCLVTGTQCSTNCEQIILCHTKYGAPIHAVQCPAKTYCQANATSGGRPACGASSCIDAKFTCTTSGGVPNPRNASQYYRCSGVNTYGSLQDCEQDTFFNTSTLRCDATTEPFDPAHLTCMESGQAGSIGEDDAFCFICNDQNIHLVYPCQLDQNQYLHTHVSQYFTRLAETLGL